MEDLQVLVTMSIASQVDISSIFAQSDFLVAYEPHPVSQCEPSMLGCNLSRQRFVCGGELGIARGRIMRFLIDGHILDAVQQLVERDGELLAAVAFWGRGAGQETGITERA